MKRLLLALVASAALAFSAGAYPGPPGTEQGSTVKGVSVDMAMFCMADDLNAESKELLNLWIELNDKLENETATQDELMLGGMLAQSGQCGYIKGGIDGTVVLLDGNDYLVDYCVPGYPCARLIQKSDGFERQ